MDALGIADPGLIASADATTAPTATLDDATAPGVAAPVADEARDGTAPNVRYGVRSAPCSLVVYVLVRFVDLWAPIAAMSFSLANLLWSAARDLPPAGRLLLGLGLAATTVLPFFGALFQPNILTTAVVLVPIIVVCTSTNLESGPSSGSWPR